MKTKNVKKIEPKQDDDWQCPCCQGTDYTATGQYPSTPHAGVRPDGTAYSRVDRERVRCLDCNQIGVRMIYV